MSIYLKIAQIYCYLSFYHSIYQSIYLVISHAQRHQHRDVHRFEKISNIIKQFKLSCSKLAAHFEAMEVISYLQGNP